MLDASKITHDFPVLISQQRKQAKGLFSAYVHRNIDIENGSVDRNRNVYMKYIRAVDKVVKDL